MNDVNINTKVILECWDFVFLYFSSKCLSILNENQTVQFTNVNSVQHKLKIQVYSILSSEIHAYH